MDLKPEMNGAAALEAERIVAHSYKGGLISSGRGRPSETPIMRDNAVASR